MISAATVHSFAERKTKNLFGMRPAWLKKDTAALGVGAEATHAPTSSLLASPDTPKIKELASAHGKPKALSKPRIRELLTIAMIRLMERMIAELFPCATEGGPPQAEGVGGDGTEAAALPTFEEFLKHICRRTRTPLTCMCLALLYLTRLRANHPRSRGSPGSSYRLALSSLCVATKYLYDDAYHTCSWVQVSMGLFSQREVNQMEMEFMYFLHYQLGVTPTEWNQWVATLEAKLVARWSEKGKAEVIYGFGLFLSYECCEPDVQEAVRDVAWGEGGRSLLSLLTNAIHVSASPDSGAAVGKASPSADSTGSELTCLPTPDPNSWFRIRSPALSGPAHHQAPSSATMAHSASITPTTAHFPAPHPQRSSMCSRHSYVEHDTGVCSSSSPLAPPITQKPGAATGPSSNLAASRQQHAPGHSARRSSQCSVAAAATSALPHHPLHAEFLDDYRGAGEWRKSLSQNQPAIYVPRSPLNPRSSSQQRMSYVGSAESTAASTGYAVRHISASPFDSFSGDMGSISLSYSAESRDAHTPSQQYNHYQNQTLVARKPNGTSLTYATSQQQQQQQQQTSHYYAAGPRSISSGHAAHHAVRSSNGSNQSFDRKSVHGVTTSSSKLSSGSTVASREFGARPVTYNGMGDLSYAGNNHALLPLPGKDQIRPATSRRTPGAASVASSHNASPAAIPYRNVRYYSNGGVGSSTVHAALPHPPLGGGATASAKSSSSSLKTSNNNNAGRRQSWRHSSSHKGTASSSFAQKLRSFAVFNWSASGNSNSGSSSNEPAATQNSPPPQHHGKDQMADADMLDDVQYADSRLHDYASITLPPLQPHSSSSSGGPSSAIPVSNSYEHHHHHVTTSASSNANGGRANDQKRNSCCPPHPHANGFAARRLTETHPSCSQGPLASAHTALETIASPSYDFEIEMTKFVSMKS
ncbi:hypothetical protein H4R26_003683 [Coemansia thaxteri]|uniref:Cyclin N-terminal domain-containing protein n=1 Tax=Coemansia thaxteri TaxID=2663907 RepID=A0A9W8BCA0_9FUNG|nr:hypothetical protein H4R26_003683 [Coemansia thaxteri]